MATGHARYQRCVADFIWGAGTRTPDLGHVNPRSATELLPDKARLPLTSDQPPILHQQTVGDLLSFQLPNREGGRASCSFRFPPRIEGHYGPEVEYPKTEDQKEHGQPFLAHRIPRVVSRSRYSRTASATIADRETLAL